MKRPISILWVSIFALAFVPGKVRADGGFIVQKFVWDKHKDIAEPTQKAILVFDAGHEDLILQVKYQGPVKEFGWLIPVPNLPKVEKGSMKCFYELSQYTQKHFEPPVLAPQSARLGLARDEEPKPEPPVKVIETKTVGDYEIAVLSTQDAGALQKWLAANQFYFPPDKSDVLDGYVKEHWFFVAVKISLTKAFPTLVSTKTKLASGELNPLQISFATERCIFPLKISSLNGKPSEVQVYVLSAEPLVEKAMLEKNLPLIYSNDLAQAARSAQSHEYFLVQQRNLHRRLMGASTASAEPPSAQAMEAIERTSQTPAGPTPEELLPYAKVTKADLPKCASLIAPLGEKSWWLTKQTWTFQPEEMRDLKFEPALAVFSDELGTRYGYFAVASLARFQSDAVPVFLAAFQNTNPTVRLNAAALFSRGYGEIYDARLADAAIGWLKDPAPGVRMAAVSVLTQYQIWKPKYAEPLISMLRDKDPGVRRTVIFGLPRFRADLEQYIPTFQAMLKDGNPDVRAAALEISQRLRFDVELSRADLLAFFKSPEPEVLGAAFTLLGGQHQEISDDEALVMLQSPQPVGRLLGLRVLDQNPEKQSVELALPLLRDPEEMVRLKASQTLRVLTGQKFSEDQPDEWMKWWVQNKTNFVVQAHPEELRRGAIR